MSFLIGAYAAAILGAGSALFVVLVLELWPRPKPASQQTAPSREPAAVISLAEARLRRRRA